MKLLYCTILFIFITTSLYSCSTKKSHTGGKLITGPAAADIVNYVNQGILAITELEQKSLESYASVTGENFTTREKLYETLKNFVIPTYKRYADGLKKITPENPEIKPVHGTYIKAAELMLEGFQTKMVGIENSDEGLITQGNKQIEDASKGVKKWLAELNELCKKHGVAFLKDKETK